ncbi:MAG: FIST C-terminal domain-containing protein [Treponema sp.]|jgi:hypothetical protein|nr:FIST C-terminal domain-containing protein [Treponema sp.]
MIKVISGVTEEIDDVEDAAAELREQIRPEVNLRSNSLGILHCPPDFFSGEVPQRLHGAFGFPVVGCASPLGSVSGKGFHMGLSLTALTSDEAQFKTAAAGDITTENYQEAIGKLYTSLVEGRTDKPVMLFCYVPFLMTPGGGRIVEALGKAAPNIPVFGSVGISLKEKFAESYALCNDEVLSSGVVLAAVFAEKAPAFYTTVLKRDKILHLREQVSMAKDKVLISIGGKTYRDYMIANKLPVSGIIPFVFFCPDGTVLDRTCRDVTPEGYGIFTGEIPVNAEIALCTNITGESIIETSDELLGRIRENHGNIPGCLLYSCVSRMAVLGADRIRESALVQEHLKGKAFTLAYSGGEIYPQGLEDGRFVNLLQNTAMTACVF